MTSFQQFIFIYFTSATMLAGIAVLWRNWLEDHPSWKDWLTKHFRGFVKMLTCGSCFTFWITLGFVLIINPFKLLLYSTPPFDTLPPLLHYFIQWMSLGWGAVFLRFLYVAIQEGVSILVHTYHKH